MSNIADPILEELPPVIHIAVPVEDIEDDPESQESEEQRRIRYILNYQEGI